MKNLLYSLTALTLLTSALTFADDAKPATTTAPKKDFTNVKIAVVDMYQVFDKSKEGADLQEAIKADVEKRIKTIQAMDAEYQKLQAEITNAGTTLSNEAREKRQKKMMSLQNDIRIEQETAQAVPQQRAQEAQMMILKKIETAVQKIAKNLGVDLVMAGNTLFVADRVDITQMIVDDLNSNYKPAAKPAAAAK